MLILKYFLTVGVALTLGLYALCTHLESDKAASGVRIHTTATLAIAPPPKPEVVEASLPETILPPEATKSSRSRHSGNSHRERRSR
jgi:hypothetical protein